MPIGQSHRKILHPRSLRWLCILFSALAFACLGYVAAIQVTAWRFEQHVHAAVISPAKHDTSHPALNEASSAAPDGSLGEMDIPDLRLSVPIFEGTGTGALLRGIGHIDGTVPVGGLGTAGFAGHRDSFFRPLAGIRPGMQILIKTSVGTYTYTTRSTRVVTPDRVDILDDTTHPGLALVTCYPFHFIGSAPKRFIVHADLDSVLPR